MRMWGYVSACVLLCVSASRACARRSGNGINDPFTMFCTLSGRVAKKRNPPATPRRMGCIEGMMLLVMGMTRGSWAFWWVDLSMSGRSLIASMG